jgi:hypothetical protein
MRILLVRYSFRLDVRRVFCVNLTSVVGEAMVTV